MARARRVLADRPEDRAEHGYLRWLAAFQSILDGETATALAGFEEAAAGWPWTSRSRARPGCGSRPKRLALR